jgi:sugar phosphate isomerase/epimerase
MNEPTARARERRPEATRSDASRPGDERSGDLRSRSRLAAFPKCFMDQLCIERSMSLFEWIEMARALPVDGLEMYSGFFTSFEPGYLDRVKSALSDAGFEMPMFCYSPDFTHPDAARRRDEVAKQKEMIAVTAYLGGSSCRVLSGQRRPDVALEQGLEFVAQAIEELIPFARQHNVRLAIENHYKDNYWTYPEFAQQQDVFCRLLDVVPSPWLGVQFDPSNAILAGDDPLVLLRRVKDRVITMHASDRFLLPGHTLDELHRVENAQGYAAILSHGVVGRGLNDYDAIFAMLRDAGFAGWISIEDGVHGLDEIAISAHFLRDRMRRYLPAPLPENRESNAPSSH